MEGWGICAVYRILTYNALFTEREKERERERERERKVLPSIRVETDRQMSPEREE